MLNDKICCSNAIVNKLYHEIILDMYEAFDWEILIEKCDRIHKENSH